MLKYAVTHIAIHTTTMKAFAMALAALALFAGISTAEAAPKTVYTVTMTGVT
jgi:hypothetical protein